MSGPIDKKGHEPEDWERIAGDARVRLRAAGGPPRVTVHDSTADVRYMVLPMRPPGTGGMDEEELASLVTRGCLIGTGVPRTPATV